MSKTVIRKSTSDLTDLIKKGTVLGKWIVDEHIGEGGFSHVFKGHHMFDRNKIVAIKVYKPKALRGDFKFFASEVEVLRKLSAHKNIIDLLDYGVQYLPSSVPSEFIEAYYVVMKYVKENLEDYVKRKEVLSIEEALRIWYSVLEGLEYAYEEFKVIHGDIKPSNILLDDEGVYVTDFNTVKMISEEYWSRTLKVSTTGEYYTPGWAAPEQEKGIVNEKTDVYLICLLYTSPSPRDRG